MENGANPGRGLKGQKATIYQLGAFGASRFEAAEFEIIDRGTTLTGRFRGPRKRSWSGLGVEREPSIVVLDGWGHPEHPIFDRSPDGKSESTRFATFDPAWRDDFNRFFGGYLEANPGVKVLADYRAARDWVRPSEIGRSGELDESAESAF